MTKIKKVLLCTCAVACTAAMSITVFAEKVNAGQWKKGLCGGVSTTTENGKKYTYSVVAVESTYGAISSESTGIEVDFPLFASVMLYAGTGESKIESDVAVDGDMTAQFYSPLKAAKGYVAIYDGERYMTRFIPVSINTSDGFVDIVIENCQSTDTIKAFLWDSDMNILDKAAVSVAQS